MTIHAILVCPINHRYAQVAIKLASLINFKERHAWHSARLEDSLIVQLFHAKIVLQHVWHVLTTKISVHNAESEISYSYMKALVELIVRMDS